MCKARALWINNESKQGPFELIRALVSKSRALLILFVRNVKIWHFIRILSDSGEHLALKPPFWLLSLPLFLVLYRNTATNSLTQTEVKSDDGEGDLEDNRDNNGEGDVDDNGEGENMILNSFPCHLHDFLKTNFEHFFKTFENHCGTKYVFLHSSIAWSCKTFKKYLKNLSSPVWSPWSSPPPLLPKLTQVSKDRMSYNSVLNAVYFVWYVITFSYC